MSRGWVCTQPFTAVENTPHEGHAGANSSAVATCTTRAPEHSSTTIRATANPSRPSNRETSEAGSPAIVGTCVISNKPVTSLRRRLRRQQASSPRSRALYINDAPDPLPGQVRRAPLRRSLTWDRGREMAEHERITEALEMPVY